MVAARSITLAREGFVLLWYDSLTEIANAIRGWATTDASRRQTTTAGNTYDPKAPIKSIHIDYIDQQQCYEFTKPAMPDHRQCIKSTLLVRDAERASFALDIDLSCDWH